MPDDGNVTVEPVKVGPPTSREPPQLVVLFERCRPAATDNGPPQPHRQVRPQWPATVIGPRHFRSKSHGHAQFLIQLTMERGERILTRLDLAAGKLPAAGQVFRPGPSSSQQLGRPGEIVDNRCCHDEHCVHR